MQNPIWLGSQARKAQVCCVFLHGRGQSPELMAEHVVARLALPGISVLLPRAPEGRWYEVRAVEPLTEAARLQLDHALDAVDAAIDELLRMGVSMDRIVLAGFSQGACLALEYALRRRRPAALVCLTGCRVGYPVEERPQQLDGLPVYLSCGDADPWIPLAPFLAAAAQLGEAGARLRVDILPGREHVVADSEIEQLQAVLNQVAASEPLQTPGCGS